MIIAKGEATILMLHLNALTGTVSPGLVVIGDNSCSRGFGFKSWHHILDGNDIFHIDLLVKLYCFFEKTKNKQKEARVGPFKELVQCKDQSSKTQA